MKRLTAFVSATAAALTVATGALAGPNAFDVAEDLSRFVWSTSPVFEDGMPAYGNFFVTEGYVYPAGTLDGGVEGTLADGSPAFPDQVIGKWICDGVFVGEGMRTTEGVLLISRQTYLFEDGDILVTQGPEMIEENTPFLRTVTGGTGDYADADPAMTQTLLGMSDGYGVRLQIRLGSELPDDRANAVEVDSGAPVGPIEETG